jgi:hypothetical protein
MKLVDRSRLVGACITALIWCTTVSAQQQSWLSYFPSVVRLQGKLVLLTKYGAPSFGADPEKDEKIEVPFLILQTPIRARPNPKSGSEREPLTNINFVQLVLPDESGQTLKQYLDQQITVAGTLLPGRRASDFAEVVMTVKAVNPTGKPF